MFVVAVAGCSATRTLVTGRSATRTRFGTLVVERSAKRFLIEKTIFFAGKRIVGAVLD